MARPSSAVLKLVSVVYCAMWMFLGLKLMQVPVRNDTGTRRDNGGAGGGLLMLLQNQQPYNPVIHNHSMNIVQDFVFNKSQQSTQNTTHKSLIRHLNATAKPVISAKSLEVPQDQMWFYETLKNAEIWDTSVGDRIIAQLAYARELSVRRPEVNTGAPKVIALSNSMDSGNRIFKEQQCPVHNCVLAKHFANEAPNADAVIFKASPPNFKKRDRQVWIYTHLESPYHTSPIPDHIRDKVNWTATYRSDSTIVTPYEKFVPYNPDIKTITKSINYARGKTKMVAWFVSNCGARNGRLTYGKELGKHIEVDIYGRCGSLRCPRSHASDCFKKLNTEYKFYLSFENSNCKDYITEKFYWNGLGNDIVPVVMGAHPNTYKELAPPHSYIHVDDFKNAQELGKYLHYLAKNDTAYNEYFAWKGTGTFINTKFMCRLCAMLHGLEPDRATWYPDFNEWWRGDTVCRITPWSS